MRKSLLLMSIVVLCCASVAFAQTYPLPGGAIGVYADDLGSNCNFADAAPGLLQFYFFHLASPGATAIEFQLDLTGFGFSMYLGDQSPFTLKIGNFHQGVSLSYQSCLTNTFYLGVATFLSTASTTTCHKVYVKNHPIPGIAGSTNPLGVDCNSPSGWLQVAGSYATFKNDGSCPCAGSVPVEESSWGQIKALYQ